jgi:hypothetical protein
MDKNLKTALSTIPPNRLRKYYAALIAAGMPETEAGEKAVELAVMVETALAAAPSPDMKVAQVAVYRNESSATTQRKLRPTPDPAGGPDKPPVYESYLSGADLRLITRESVEIDRGVCLLLGPRFDQSKRGAPKKAHVRPDRQWPRAGPAQAA